MPPHVPAFLRRTKRWFSSKRPPPAVMPPGQHQSPSPTDRDDQGRHDPSDLGKPFLLAPIYCGLISNNRLFCQRARFEHQWWSIQFDPKKLCNIKQKRRVFFPKADRIPALIHIGSFQALETIYMPRCYQGLQRSTSATEMSPWHTREHQK
jgi:hypothetical protein